jgi:hypothetical protein
MTIAQALLMFASGGATMYLIIQWGREPKPYTPTSDESDRAAPDPQNKILNAPKPKKPGSIDFG